jgi:toxin ParE1/3/4
MPHRLTQRARADLDDIWRYLATESGTEAIADNQIDELTDRFYILANWPLLGRSRGDLKRGLRSHPVGEYVIFYRLQRRDVIIQRVLHGRRNIASLLGHS